MNTILAFLVLIGIMVFIHELGHYLAAIFFGVRVEAFSLGFGPRLFGFKRGDTDFKVCAIPLGGYVKMSGEMYGDGTTGAISDASDPGSFLAKPRWQRLIIAFAGPAMNMILAVVLLAGLYSVSFPQFLVSNEPTVVAAVDPTTPAAKAGMAEGDHIVEFAGLKNPRWDDVVTEMRMSTGKPLTVVYEREGQRKSAIMTPVEDPQTGLGELGFEGAYRLSVKEVSPGRPADKAGLKANDLIESINGKKVHGAQGFIQTLRASEGKAVQVAVERDGKSLSFPLTPERYVDGTEKEPQWRIGVRFTGAAKLVQLGIGDALRESMKQNVRSAGMFYRLIEGIVVRRMSPNSVAGPVGLAVAAGQAAQAGPATYVELMAGVSLNLAVVNLLPIPILDGGMIVMLLIEMIARRDLSLKLKENVLKAGLAFLLTLVVLVMYNDVSKIVR